MPEVPRSEFREGLKTSEIPTLFRVATFYRIVVTLLEEKAAEYGIADLRRFYASAAFQAARFTHDAERGVIVHSAA